MKPIKMTTRAMIEVWRAALLADNPENDHWSIDGLCDMALWCLDHHCVPTAPAGFHHELVADNAAPQVPERGPINDRTLQTPADAARTCMRCKAVLDDDSGVNCPDGGLHIVDLRAASSDKYHEAAAELDRFIDMHMPHDCGGDGQREALTRARDLLWSIPSAGRPTDPSGGDPVFPLALADRIERAIDPEYCNYGPSEHLSTGESVPRIIVSLRASEWRGVIRALRSAPSATERIDKLTWQVRDTCARAERAEGALRLAQSALRQWTESYARWSEQMPVAMDRKLPPGNHMRALEAIEEHFKAGPQDQSSTPPSLEERHRATCEIASEQEKKYKGNSSIWWAAANAIQSYRLKYEPDFAARAAEMDRSESRSKP